MTDKMRCPFCGAELKEGKDCFISCFETDCQCFDGFRKNVYYALISGQKAQETLEQIKDICELNFKLDNADIRNIYRLVASITKGDKK